MKINQKGLRKCPDCHSSVILKTDRDKKRYYQCTKCEENEKDNNLKT